MSKILWWAWWVTFATVLVAGVGTAFALWNTMAGTGGTTGGVMLHGIPTFAHGFQQGWNAGGGNHGGAPGAGQSSWNGPSMNWYGGGQQSGTGPARHRAPHPRAGQAPM